MPGPHLFISALWFISSILSIYPYILGFKNTEELKEPFSFIWTFSIICAVSCFGTISTIYYVSPTGSDSVLDFNNTWHLASLFANLSFASMIFVKKSQTRIAVVETIKVICLLPFMICKGTMEIIFSITNFSFNKASKILSNQKQHMARK